MFRYEFSFSPGMWVLTPWGDMGIVQVCSINRSGGQDYYIQRKDGGEWFDGRDLKLLPTIDGKPVPIPDQTPDPGPMPGPMPRPDWPTFPDKPTRVVHEDDDLPPRKKL